jgi:predicted amidohydrolase YtcJ
VLGNGTVYKSVKSTFCVNAIQVKGGRIVSMDKKFVKTRTTDLVDLDGREHASRALEGPETCPGTLLET